MPRRNDKAAQGSESARDPRGRRVSSETDARRRRKDKRRTPRLAVEQLTPGELLLDRSQAHYVRSVLGLAPGDDAVLFDGRGHEATARVLEVSREDVRLELGGVADAAEPSIQLTVALAGPKGERADWAVEKLTELGAARIVWLQTERSVATARPGSARHDRWLRLARAAASQSGRATVPRIEGPVPLDELWLLEAEQRLIASPSATESLLRAAARHQAGSTLVAIGPEGGFTDDELARAQKEDYTAVTLGFFTLRVETAAVAAAAIILGACGRERTP